MTNIVAEPNELIERNGEALSCLLATLSVVNDNRRTEVQDELFLEALRQNKVTTHEALTAFWMAYGDPYLKDGRIEFRNLMKYILEIRGEKDELKDLGIQPDPRLRRYQ